MSGTNQDLSSTATIREISKAVVGWEGRLDNPTDKLVSGGRFVSFMTSGNNNYVVSGYWHPNELHGALAKGQGREEKRYAEAGKWAFSVDWRAGMGNKTFYDVNGETRDSDGNKVELHLHYHA